MHGGGSNSMVVEANGKVHVGGGNGVIAWWWVKGVIAWWWGQEHDGGARE